MLVDSAALIAFAVDPNGCACNHVYTAFMVVVSFRMHAYLVSLQTLHTALSVALFM